MNAFNLLKIPFFFLIVSYLENNIKNVEGSYFFWYYFSSLKAPPALVMTFAEASLHESGAREAAPAV